MSVSDILRWNSSINDLVAIYAKSSRHASWNFLESIYLVEQKTHVYFLLVVVESDDYFGSLEIILIDSWVLDSFLSLDLLYRLVKLEPESKSASNVNFRLNRDISSKYLRDLFADVQA